MTGDDSHVGGEPRPRCPDCGADAIIVRRIDSDPVKPHPDPDRLECLTCGLDLNRLPPTNE